MRQFGNHWLLKWLQPSARPTGRALDRLDMSLGEFLRQARVLVVGGFSSMNGLDELKLGAVDTVETARKAVNMAWNGDYHLLVLELSADDARFAAHAIRKIPDYAFTPIIALLSEPKSAERRQLIEAGINEVLAVPVNPQILYAAIVRAMDHSIKVERSARTLLTHSDVA